MFGPFQVVDEDLGVLSFGELEWCEQELNFWTVQGYDVTLQEAE